MEKDHLYEMYGSDDIDLVKPMASDAKITTKGLLTEIKIGDQSLTVVDPALVQRLDSLIRAMQNRIAVLEQDLRATKARVSGTEKGLSDARNELRTKISYE